MSLSQDGSQTATSLPLDIFYLLIKHIPLNTRVLANLALCSKSFYHKFNTLLYRDVHIYAPTQLIQLYESQQSRSKLEITHALRLGEEILYDEAWTLVLAPYDPVYYLLQILQATVSLRWLQVVTSKFGVTAPCETSQGSLVYAQLKYRLGPLLDEGEGSFLPNLNMLSISGHRDPFVRVPRSRPVMLYCRWQPTELDVHVGPNSSNVDLSGAIVSDSAYEEAYSSTPSSHIRPLSAIDVGSFIRDTIRAEPISHAATHITDLSIHVSYHDASDLPSSINAPLPWIKGMLSAFDHHQLEVLNIDYPAIFPGMSVNEQFTIVLEVAKVLPALVEATIAFPSIRWHKGPGRMVIDDDVKELIDELGDQPSLIYPNLSDWTPMPNDPSEGVLAWWIDSLDLKLPSQQSPDVSEAIAKLARQLMIGMLMRWPEGYYDLHDTMDDAAEYVHGEGQLEEAILELLNSSDTSETSNSV